MNPVSVLPSCSLLSQGQLAGQNSARAMDTGCVCWAHGGAEDWMWFSMEVMVGRRDLNWAGSGASDVLM